MIDSTRLYHHPDLIAATMAFRHTIKDWPGEFGAPSSSHPKAPKSAVTRKRKGQFFPGRMTCVEQGRAQQGYLIATLSGNKAGRRRYHDARIWQVDSNSILETAVRRSGKPAAGVEGGVGVIFSALAPSGASLFGHKVTGTWFFDNSLATADL